ncbi:hypothetical protein E2C01_076443 [Portunus trituberculatus]|uniref:Uncharacterized protein n=1 Tax=Portunus trituberculatus TaxID=210409 RepID=A0A5B7IM22_PORTR|nr:hypothetical protein [Portunus trituberculatus]
MAYPPWSPLYFLAPEYTNQPLLVFLGEPTYLFDDEDSSPRLLAHTTCLPSLEPQLLLFPVFSLSASHCHS